MYTYRATHVTGELFAALQKLIPQLTSNNLPPTMTELADLLASKTSLLLVARWPGKDEPIVGCLTLVIFRIPTGVRSHIEDVVVDGSYRGNGIGEALTQEGLRLARDAGANGVSLTSNYRREAANQLYQKLGFKLRKTNAYFYSFQ